MAKTRKLQVEIVGDAKSLQRAFGNSGQSASKFETVLGRVNGGLGRFAKRAAAAAAVAAAAAGVGIVKATDAASDLDESINKARQTFEKSSPVIQKWSKTTATSLGLSRQAALEGASSIGAMLKPMGVAPKRAAEMSRTMTQLAADMASFNNEDPTEMLDRIRSGLSGESEPLKRFGTVLSETRVKTFAYAQGIAQTGEELTEAQKIQARYGLLLKDTADQQGDFARTSDGLANSQRIAKAQFTDMAAEIGRVFIPIAAVAFTKVNELIDAFRVKWPIIKPYVTSTLAAIGQFWTQYGKPALEAFGTAVVWLTNSVIANWPKIQATAASVFKWIDVNVAPIVTGMAAIVVAAIQRIAQFWDTYGKDILNITRAVFGGAKILVEGILRQMRAAINLILAVLKGDWGKAWDSLKTLALNPINTLKNLLVSTLTNLVPALAGLALTLGKSITTKIGQGIKSVALGIGAWANNNIVAPIAGIVDNVKGKATAVGSAIKSGIRDGASGMLKAVGNIFVGFIRGILRVLGKIPIIGGKIPKPESIPEFADGTILNRPTLAVVGEDGPEAVIPLGAKRRKRGAELLQRAASIIGMPGDFPGIPLLAEGAIYPGFSTGAGSWASTQVALLKAQQNGNILDDIKSFAARGLAAVVDQLPLVPAGLPPEAAALASGVKEAIVSGLRHLFDRKSEWNPDKIMQAFQWASSVMGRPYVWGGGHGGWNYNLPGYDCSGFASHGAKKAGSTIGAPGTTMSLFPASHGAKGNEAALWGFRGMSSGDPRRQHMGLRLLGTWYQFGNPGHSGGTDSQWDHLRTIPGLPGYRNGTSYVPETGPAILHRGEMVLPSETASAVRAGGTGPLVHVETMVVREASDIDAFASRLGRQVSMRLAS